MTSVVISIVNWNGYAHTARCLQSIEEADWPSCEVVVVDNASADDSVLRLREEFPKVQIIRANSNLGFAGGHKLALDYALSLPHCNLFWMLNNDTRVVPQTLPAFLEAYQQFGDAIYGGVPLNDDYTIEALTGVELDQSGAQVRDLYVLTGQRLDCVFPDSSIRWVSSIHGSTFVVPLSIVRQHGFLDEIYFLYAEELDYCFRLGLRGVQCLMVPAAVVFHGDSESTRGNLKLECVVRYYATRNYLFFVRRQHGARRYAGELLRSVVKIMKLATLDLFSRQPTRARHRYSLWGALDSLIGRMGKTLAPEDYI